MAACELTWRQRQIYRSAPPHDLDQGRRRTAFGLVLVLGCERLLREGRLAGAVARLAAAQVQAARLLAVEATEARWPTRRGDLLRRRAADGLAEALAARALADASAPHRLAAASDLLDEVIDWLRDGAIAGRAAPAAVDRLRVAQAILREHRFSERGPRAVAPPTPAPEPGGVVPEAWRDDD